MQISTLGALIFFDTCNFIYKRCKSRISQRLVTGKGRQTAELLYGVPRARGQRGRGRWGKAQVVTEALPPQGGDEGLPVADCRCSLRGDTHSSWPPGVCFWSACSPLVHSLTHLLTQPMLITNERYPWIWDLGTPLSSRILQSYASSARSPALQWSKDGGVAF
jgi:hypothetical protein